MSDTVELKYDGRSYEMSPAQHLYPTLVGIKLALVPVAHHADQSKALEIKCIIAVP